MNENIVENNNENQYGNSWFYIISLFVISIIFLIYRLYLFNQYEEKTSTYEQTYATLVSSQIDKQILGKPLYREIITYDVDGVEYELTSSFLTPFTPKIGKVIYVIYDKSYPEIGYSKGNRSLMLILASLILLFYTIYLVIKKYKVEDRN